LAETAEAIFEQNLFDLMRQRVRKLVLRRERLEVGKPAQYRCFQKFEMCDLGSEFYEATLTVGNLGAEQVLMVTIEGVAFQVFVGSVAYGNGSARQSILDPSVKA